MVWFDVEYAEMRERKKISSTRLRGIKVDAIFEIFLSRATKQDKKDVGFVLRVSMKEMHIFGQRNPPKAPRLVEYVRDEEKRLVIRCTLLEGQSA